MLHPTAPPGTLHALHGARWASSIAHSIQVGELGQLCKLRVTGLGVLRRCQQASLIQLCCQGSLQCQTQLIIESATTQEGGNLQSCESAMAGTLAASQAQMTQGPLPEGRAANAALMALDGDAP